MELLQPGTTYHIYNHANGFDNLFREERNYSYFLKRYEEYILPIAETYSYCLMPNHFHLLLKIKDESFLMDALSSKLRLKVRSNLQGFQNLEGLISPSTSVSTATIEPLISKSFSNFFNSYTKSINKAYQRRGSLFNPRFKRKSILTNEQFISTFLYIHLNPVKHGYVNIEEEWKWSSLHHYAGIEQSLIINKEKALNLFGGYEGIVRYLNERREHILNQPYKLYND